ncbi:MAG: error-prone DNA polymerase [Acidobacteria bacterium]|nr:error-prone DNA polymerase [Acidobacteriota bacterium]
MADRDGKPPGPPARNWIGPGEKVGPIVAPGDRKEKARVRSYVRGGAPASRRYAELRAASAFSFLSASSLPEDLVVRAAALGLPAVALIDRNGVSGAPRFYKAAKLAGIKALVGADIVMKPLGADGRPLKLQEDAPPHVDLPDPPILSLLVENRTGYKNLCRLLTTAARGKPKGSAVLRWDELTDFTEGLHVLAGAEGSALHRTLEEDGLDGAKKHLAHIESLFPGRVHLELQRHGILEEAHRNVAWQSLSSGLRIPTLATNGVKHAQAPHKELLDVLTCIRHHTHLDAAGTLLERNRERHLKSAAEMADAFHDVPFVLERSAELADRLSFTLADLGYQFPAYPLPPGETPDSFLSHITWNGARTRFRPLSSRAQAQIEKELRMIAKLGLAGYFLIVWDIVQFAKQNGVLVQGRGSAANSAVCYALSITAVDPVRMDLLFERFLSEERGEWPDIDLDLPSGDARESVIQYVYKRYGPHGAAMTANVITYRDRSACREVAKSLGFSPGQVDSLAKQIGTFTFGEYRETKPDPHDPRPPGPGEAPGASFEEAMRRAGFDPSEARVRHFGRLWREIQNLPRHLGQHSGGMVVAAGRLDEVVPLEPAAMENRVIIQWDKDDCADLGIVKVDLLGLGMLGAIAEMIPMIETHEKVRVDLAHLPENDPLVYKMLNAADTIGMFQVESRAQMASLPRHAPKVFYDIVVQVAIIRPGPIVGGMVHPFFDRRQGKAPVTYPHPSLEPILARTLGVPLFQEQILRVAMVAAGFTGGEAEELRRAMGFKRSMERMGEIEQRLRDGMTRNGIDMLGQEQIVKSITSFALYGFPESHAASFALIAYASAYLKAHHPTAFLACLLNAWPMGFYHPATLVKDSQRHGVTVLPVDVNASGWLCRFVERPNPAPPETYRPLAAGAVRVGLRFVKGLRKPAGEAIEREQARAPFATVKDLARRTGLHANELDILAHAGAFGSLGLSRRAALWQVAEAGRDLGPLYDALPLGGGMPLEEMTPLENTLADYEDTSVTAGPHVLAHLRHRLDAQGVLPLAWLTKMRDGEWVKAAGAVVVRQRPGTAKGFVFVSLEDETGMVQAIVRPDLFRDNRSLIVGAWGLVVEGKLQATDGALSIKAVKFAPLPLPSDVPERPRRIIESHDFH